MNGDGHLSEEQYAAGAEARIGIGVDVCDYDINKHYSAVDKWRLGMAMVMDICLRAKVAKYKKTGLAFVFIVFHRIAFVKLKILEKKSKKAIISHVLFIL